MIKLISFVFTQLVPLFGLGVLGSAGRGGGTAAGVARMSAGERAMLRGFVTMSARDQARARARRGRNR